MSSNPISPKASEWCVQGGGSTVQHKVQCPTGRFVHMSKRGGVVCPHPTSMVRHKLWDCTRVQIANVPSRERGILGQGMAIVRHAHRSINQPEQLVLSFVQQTNVTAADLSKSATKIKRSGEMRCWTHVSKTYRPKNIGSTTYVRCTVQQGCAAPTLLSPCF